MKPSPECINEKKEKYIVIRKEVDVGCFKVSSVGINWPVRNTNDFLGLLRVTLHGNSCIDVFILGIYEKVFLLNLGVD
jgi:hypothetical protein